MDVDLSKALEDLFMAGQALRYSKGDIVMRGDEEVTQVCYIGKGHVKIYSINDQGDEYIHIIYKTGDIFPLIQIFNQSAPRRIFYEALDSSVVWKLPKEKFLDYIKSNSNTATYALLSQLADQFNIFADRLDNLEYRTAYERVVYRLLFLAGRFGRQIDKGLLIDAPITHKIIANSINLSRESVSREMEKLQADNLITAVKGRIVIKDIKRLSQGFSEPVSTDLWGLKTN